MYAFISYQTADKNIAMEIKKLLDNVGIASFLAHEDIGVSEEWRVKILEEIRKTDIFICLLSVDYLSSPWCIQEAGIAAFREGVTVLPLSIDGTIPMGFISNVQSVIIDSLIIKIDNLIPGFLKHDFSLGIDIIINTIKTSGSFKSAESNFELILPHVGKLNDAQIANLLKAAASNRQVSQSSGCARDYIPPLLKSHGHLLDSDELEYLKRACARYA